MNDPAGNQKAHATEEQTVRTMARYLHGLIEKPTDPVEAAKAAALSVARGSGPETVEERLALDGRSSLLPSEATLGEVVRFIAPGKCPSLQQLWSPERLLELTSCNIFTSSLLVNYTTSRGLPLACFLRDIKTAAASIPTQTWASPMIEHLRELMKSSAVRKFDKNYAGFLCCALVLMSSLESEQMGIVLAALASLQKPVRKASAEQLVKTAENRADLMALLEMLREFITLSTIEQLGRLGLDTLQLDTLTLRSRQWMSFLSECRKPIKGALEIIAAIWKANSKLRGPERIPPEEFHNDAISQTDVLLRHEVTSWIISTSLSVNRGHGGHMDRTASSSSSSSGAAGTRADHEEDGHAPSPPQSDGSETSSPSIFPGGSSPGMSPANSSDFGENRLHNRRRPRPDGGEAEPAPEDGGSMRRMRRSLGAPRQLADFGVLTTAPCVLDVGARVRVLRLESEHHAREVSQQHALMRAQSSGMILPGGRILVMAQDIFTMLKVRRDHLLEDSLRQLAGFDADELKRVLKVQFQGEQGVDEGGVQKEFFLLLVQEMYDENYAMFEYNKETRTFWFSNKCLESNLQYELFGIVIGLAIYSGVILDVNFPLIVYRKLLSTDKEGRIDRPSLEVIEKEFDPDFAQGLRKFLDFQGDVEATFGLTMSTDYEYFGERIIVDLVPDGRNIPVTNANRYEYVERIIDWKVNVSIARQFWSFKRGFDKCIGQSVLFQRLFKSPSDLELLICGTKELDFEALRSNTIYDDGFTKDSPVIQ
ncbi:hypothetical protein FOZ61_010070 [Perkinsus olseni]|uniref:HECT-type E3 ubiquitin transferase n=1 Tax=Perkinsus olseni TaxID=32597 RepID=A0A7J6KZ72_PEROL